MSVFFEHSDESVFASTPSKCGSKLMRYDRPAPSESRVVMADAEVAGQRQIRGP